MLDIKKSTRRVLRVLNKSFNVMLEKSTRLLLFRGQKLRARAEQKRVIAAQGRGKEPAGSPSATGGARGVTATASVEKAGEKISEERNGKWGKKGRKIDLGVVRVRQEARAVERGLHPQRRFDERQHPVIEK